MDTKHSLRGWLEPSRVPLQGRDTSTYTMLAMAVACYFLISMQIFSANVTGHPVSLSYMLEPEDSPLTEAEALSSYASGQFTKIPDLSGQLDIGYQQRPAWVMMEFNPPENLAADSYFVQLRHAYLNGSFSNIQKSESGDLSISKTSAFTDTVLPRTQGMNDIRYISFPMLASEGETFRALFKLKAHVLSVQFVVQEEKAFLSSALRELVPIAVLLGGLSFLAFYNLMVGFVRREPEFLFYGAYVCGVVLVAASINGTGHLFLWPDVLWMHYNSANMFINLANLSYLGFAHFMFRDTPYSRWEGRVWVLATTLCVVGLFLQVFEGGFYASLQANLCLLTVLLLGLVRSVFARKQYGRIANLFILSELCLFSGVVVWCMKMFGLLPSTSFTLNLVLLSSSLEAVMFSFVLSEKMRRTMEEKESALAQLIVANKELEERVRDKTLALASRYTSHEVLNPVFAIRLKSERVIEVMTAESMKTHPSFARVHDVVIEKSRQICQLLESISGTIRTIKSISSTSVSDEREELDLSSLFDDALRIIEAKTVHANCRISSDFTAAQSVYARRSDVIHVFVNLLSNALDATASGGASWIRVQSEIENPFQNDGSGSVRVSVTDSGPGIDAEIAEKLFLEPVTSKQGQGGMGFGLRFCRQLLERNAGSIGFDLKASQTLFFFVLPSSSAERSEAVLYSKAV